MIFAPILALLVASAAALPADLSARANNGEFPKDCKVVASGKLAADIIGVSVKSEFRGCL